MKEKKITWNKSGRESAKRVADFYTMIESAATDEKQEERDRDKLSDRLEEFRKRKEEEDEAMCLIEEMRKNLEAAQTIFFEAEQRHRGRLKTIMTKLSLLMQSRDTKNRNLDKDLEEILSEMKQMGGSGDKTRRLWAQDEGEDQ